MPSTEMQPPGNGAAKAGGTAKIVYVLYLGGVIIGLLAVIGVIVAYVNRNDAGAWVADHYRFQIRTFWIGLLLGAVGVLTSFVVIGWAVLMIAVVWWIVRCVKGLNYMSRSEPYPNVTTWVW